MPDTRPRDRYWYLLPLLLCALIRLGWLARFAANPIAPVDAEGFYLLAVNLRAGRGFAIGWSPPFCPNAIRTPLYPVFLLFTYAGLGADPAQAVIAQVLLEVLTTALLIALGRDLALGIVSPPDAARAGFWAGIGYALNGTATRYTGVLLAEPLLISLLAWALWMTVRTLHRPTGMRAGGAGLAWGLAVLTKPNVQYLAIASIGWIAFWALRERPICWSSILAGGGLFLAVLVPWMARNHRHFDRWILSTAFEENLARVAAVATLADLRDAPAEPWSETWEYLYARFAEEVTGRNPDEEPDLRCVDRIAWHRQLARAARMLVRTNLGTYARVHLRGVADALLDPGHRIWYGILTGRAWHETGVVANIWDRIQWSLARGAVGDAIEAFASQRVCAIPPVAAAVWWGAFGIRAGLAAFFLRGLGSLGHDAKVAVLLAGSAVYLIVLPGPIAHDRFFLPALAAILPLAACGLICPLGNRKRGSWR